MKLILASGSPRRIELLKKITTNFDILTTKYNEDIIKQFVKDPKELVKELSIGKANDVFNSLYMKYLDYMPLVIVSADTTVSYNNEIIGKPKNRQDAIHILSKLQGKMNKIFTGTTVVIQKNGTIITVTSCSESNVYIKHMSYQDITEYIHTKEPFDKAGAYAIQGIGKKYIERFEGNFDATVGLDVSFIESVFKKYNLIQGA